MSAERSTPSGDVAAFASARDAVLQRIAAACARAGRDSPEVELVAVSKSVSPERIRAALRAGHDLFGENRVQEAAGKVPLVHGARWHMVGRLQANKARRAVELFETIHSVDSVELAERLDRVAGDVSNSGQPTAWRERLPVYLQVNIDRDPAKSGFQADALDASMPGLAKLYRLELLGLMTVGRLAGTPDQASPTFARLRELSERLRATHPALGRGLSMGMTDDFEVAVEEGATVVRIGRALFGERPDRDRT